MQPLGALRLALGHGLHGDALDVHVCVDRLAVEQAGERRRRLWSGGGVGWGGMLLMEGYIW